MRRTGEFPGISRRRASTPRQRRDLITAWWCWRWGSRSGWSPRKRATACWWNRRRLPPWAGSSRALIARVWAGRPGPRSRPGRPGGWSYSPRCCGPWLFWWCFGVRASGRAGGRKREPWTPGRCSMGANGGGWARRCFSMPTWGIWSRISSAASSFLPRWSRRSAGGAGGCCSRLASIAGNLTVAALNYPGPYRSLGASTAIFAGLGLLTGRAIRVLRRPGRPHPWRAMFAPLAAGITLLALFGAGGLQTDVGAHLMGFAAGLVLGFAAGLPSPGRAARI